MAADGRYVVFQSEASNLVPNDFNGVQDVYRRDLVTGTTELVSRALSGDAGDGVALQADVSANGRYVVWSSDAPDLVVGDSNGTWDVFVRDMLTGTTTLLSRDHLGNLATLPSDRPRITTNGRFVVFESDADLVPTDTNGLKDVYRVERATGQLTLISVTASGVQGNDGSNHGAISEDGQRVVFTSGATTFVTGDTNNQVDVFLKNLTTGVLLRVNVSSSGTQANAESSWPSISGDGSTIAFCSVASNLVGGDTNGDWDLFGRAVASGITTRLNVQPNGQQADGYVRSPAALSWNGNLVCFASGSTNLVVGDTNGNQDVFVRNRATSSTRRLSLDSLGGEVDGDCFVPHMTLTGQVLTYTSDATNIVPGDGNGRRDVFAVVLGFDIGVSHCPGLNTPNSSGQRGLLRATGSVLVQENGITLFAEQLPNHSFGFIVTSLTGTYPVVTFGPYLCMSGAIGRYVGPGQIKNTGTMGGFSLALDLTQTPSPAGFVTALSGETRYFQCWHRDFVQGQPRSNFTDALSITLY